jgi:methoxymalonate biosynthesis acyl carrier protein
MLDKAETKAAVRAFLGKLCSVDQCADDDNIFADGFVNSLYLVQLLQFVQKNCQVTIEEDDFDMANFISIQAIADFVARKQGSA